MNAEVYLFGDLGNGYTQYVDDDSRKLFKRIASKATANTQLVIHREDTLVYYTYIRRLKNAESSNIGYIGICYTVNNRLIQDIDGLFDIFEGTITTIVSRGVILEFTDEGNIVPSAGKLYNAKSEFAHAVAYLKNEIDVFMQGKNDILPPLNYAINNNEITSFLFENSRDNILNALSTYHTIFIYKDSDYDDEELKSYADKLRRLSKLIKELKKAIIEKDNQIYDLRKAKSKFTWVISLLVLIFIGAIIFYIHNDKQNLTIHHQEYKIEDLNDSISNLTDSISLLDAELDWAIDTLIKAENAKEQIEVELKDSIVTLQRIRREEKQMERSLRDSTNVIKKLRSDVKSYEKTIESQKKQINTNVNVWDLPLVITDLQVANVDYHGKIINDYGNSIASENSMYLKPKIKYFGISSGKKITLLYKFYHPNGSLITGKYDDMQSPKDGSFNFTLNTAAGSNQFTLLGWGGDKGHYRKGDYRIEIWYNNLCLYKKTLTIY